MSARLLLLCPGQGGQYAGMNDMARADPAAARFLDGVALPDGSLFDNRVAQAAVVAATLAMWMALRAGVAALGLRPALVAGYSVGELSAYGVAGAFEASTCVTLAHARARLMDAAAAASLGGQTLAAISGVSVTGTARLAAAAGWAIAIVNSHDSCVAGGPLAQLPALQQLVADAGGRLQPLPVTVAAHTPLLAGAVAPFARLLENTPFGPLACPVLCGIDGSSNGGTQAAVAQARASSVLSRQLAETIAWADCMDAAAEGGINVALELGPGAALARMLQARHPAIACRSVSEFRSTDGVVAWLERAAR